ncbi:MAG: LON peptidase substrate-binding domain-containing protein, partial [Alphaproteobacteria bacterium]|nr:LON peptidase substrate-binding domain-containing protein [Alphaproteobacteria bacterium]
MSDDQSQKLESSEFSLEDSEAVVVRDPPIPMQQAPLNLPLLPLRDLVIFPAMAASLLVGREESITAVNAALGEGRMIALFTQTEPEIKTPSAQDLHDFGVEAKILQYLKMPDGAIKILVEGQRRMRLLSIIDGEVKRVEAEFHSSTNTGNEDIALAQGLLKHVLEQLEKYGEMNSRVADQFPDNMLEGNDPDQIADFLAQLLPTKLDQKQQLLSCLSVSKRLAILLEIIENEISVQLVERKIRSRVRSQMEKSQKEFYLSEQIKAIKHELGEGEDACSELEELETRIKETDFPQEVAHKAMTEFKRLKNMSPVSAEATVIRNYLDWLLDVPWNKQSRLKHDIRRADKVLKDDHYGLDKVRERILEHLAVQARSKDVRGGILCFVGPPGVGKTSMGRSIAKATGREFVRMALGGVHDESEIRGHRRTYIGAMPGRIIQAMKKAGTCNPLILLDEI